MLIVPSLNTQTGAATRDFPRPSQDVTHFLQLHVTVSVIIVRAQEEEGVISLRCTASEPHVTTSAHWR